MANEKEVKDVKELSEIEKVLTPKKLKEYASGENGEFIKLVDVEQTKSLLLEIANKHKNIVVSRDNYKKEAKSAEKELRDARLALQRIHKSNNSLLNKAKKDEKELYESLIDIVSGEEKKIREKIDEIDSAIRKEKEEAELRERRKKEELESNIKKYELFFEGKISGGKTDSDLVEYNKKLDEMQENIDKDIYGEFGYKAIRVQAVYEGRRSELESRIESEKARAKEIEELNAEKEKREKQAEVALKFRLNHIEATGFKVEDEAEIEKIKGLSEVEWYDYLEAFVDLAKEKKEKQKKDAKEAIKKIKGIWSDLVSKYIELGGGKNDFDIAGRVPTDKELEKLKSSISSLKERNLSIKKKGVKKEISYYQNRLLKTLSDLDKKRKEQEFEHEESKTIIDNLMTETEKVVNRVLGDNN